MAWYLSQISCGVRPSSRALFSVAVPYSSVPHTKSKFHPRKRPYLRKKHMESHTKIQEMLRDRETCSVKYGLVELYGGVKKDNNMPILPIMYTKDDVS